MLNSSELGSELQKLDSNILALDTVISTLRKLSLIQRDTMHKELKIHPLVQAVIKDQMALKQQIIWAERAVKATCHLFSFPLASKDASSKEFSQAFTTAERYVAAAEHCVALIDIYGEVIKDLPEAIELCGRLNAYKDFLQEK